MAAARLGAPERGACDEGADHEHVLGFPAGGVVEDLVEGVAGPEVDHFEHALEFVPGAFDADVLPHRGAEGGPDVGEVEDATMKTSGVFVLATPVTKAAVRPEAGAAS